MAEDWDAIAAEVADAIGEVGFTATLEQPGTPTGPEWDPTPGTPTQTAITVIDDTTRLRDNTGAFTGEVIRTLTVATGAVVPSTDDRIRVRGVWHEVEAVMPLAPGGVDLLYEVEIQV